MQDSNTTTPSPTADQDELSAVQGILEGNPETGAEPVPPVAEQDAQPEEAPDADAPEIEGKPAIDYAAKVPMPNGDPISVGELKDYYQQQQQHKLDMIERENAVVREKDQASLLLSYVDNLPPEIAEAAKMRAVTDYRRELEILHASIPESTTPEGAAKMKSSLYALADSYGVPHRAIDQIRDATTIKMMYDYARLREGIREAKEKVKPLRAADTPGQRAPRQQGNELQSKIDRAKTTRNSADELAAVDALLRSA